MIDQASRLRALVMGGGSSVVAEPLDSNRGVDTHVIAVTSGKGGVGKTTIAVNLAILLAGSGKKVLVVDADLGLANVDVMLGLDTARHIGHLLVADYDACDVAVVGPAGIHVISGGSGLRELADANDADRNRLIGKLRSYFAHFDCVIVDTSPGIRDDVVDFVAEANEILLVTTPEPTALRDTYAAAKTLNRRLPEMETRIVVNMAGSEKEANGAIEVLNSVSQKFLARRYEHWYTVEADQMVSRSIHAHKAVVGLFPRSAAAACLRSLALEITGRLSFRGL